MKTLAKWSLEEYHRMITSGIFGDRRLESLDGEIVEMSATLLALTYNG